MSKHTPGPWELDLGPTNILRAGPVRMGCGAGAYAEGMQAGAVRWANARLIAAAPDMADALKTALIMAEELLDVTADDYWNTGPETVEEARRMELYRRAESTISTINAALARAGTVG